VAVIRQLLEAGAHVQAYDPAAMERAREVLPAGEKMSYATDPYEAAQQADAVLILTEWKQFAELDLARLHRALKFPIVVDGRNLYRPETMAEHGFTYVSIGRPASYEAQVGKPQKPGA
jgi:UDPglucose 6-dehydrogenase